MASNAPKTKRDVGGQSAKSRDDKKATPPSQGAKTPKVPPQGKK